MITKLSAELSDRLAQLALEVVVAEGNGHRIGDVGRLGRRGEAELVADRPLHLALGGAAVAGEQPLDLRGGVAADRNAGLRRGQANHAAGVAHQDRRPRPLVVRIQLFDAPARPA